MFGTLATQRDQFARELETCLVSAGEEHPQDQGGTMAGAVHRGWIDLKSALTKQDTHAILAEVERGEDSAKKAYQDALEEKDLSADIKTVIAKQSAEILLAHNRVRDLRDATKKG